MAMVIEIIAADHGSDQQAKANGYAASVSGDGDGDDLPYIVFGYGSLIFRPPPHVIKNSPGFLKGYVRRFAQKSHDHRGTLQNPGRVVTLIHQEDWAAFSSAVDSFPHEDIVWGIAYTIDPAHATEVRAYLDHREKDGYTLERVDVYGLIDGVHETVVIPGAECYVGRNDNPSFIGSEPLSELSDIIWRAVGPSGPNKDYVYNLAAAVRALAPEAYDSHLFALEVRPSWLLGPPPL
ncbi:ChaC-like protein-domain-containing protein [Russula emetica]|nr:ChaC-like protein-domain-containing protein [Russula emetica]